MGLGSYSTVVKAIESIVNGRRWLEFELETRRGSLIVRAPGLVGLLGFLGCVTSTTDIHISAIDFLPTRCEWYCTILIGELTTKKRDMCNSGLAIV